ncbi:MAG TPA: hypothetical protein VMF89_15050, partial [Polyangiales bacterium]|nr:hypothetical protein [Polyangiales bacterium]
AAQHPLVQPVELGSAPDPQLADEGEAGTFARLPVGADPKPSSPARLTRLTHKATVRARSKEAKLGLKDPFE